MTTETVKIPVTKKAVIARIRRALKRPGKLIELGLRPDSICQFQNISPRARSNFGFHYYDANAWMIWDYQSPNSNPVKTGKLEDIARKVGVLEDREQIEG